MAKKICCIPGCPSKSTSVKLFNISNNKHIFEAWQKVLRLKCPELRLRFGQDRRICKLHFEARYINSNNNKIISAVPTLFTAHEIRSGAPAEPILLDHGLFHESMLCPRVRLKFLKDSDVKFFKASFSEYTKIGDVYKPKENDSTEVKEETNVESSLEEHKQYCASHDHQYNVKPAVILTGVGSPPSPTPSEEKSNNGFLPLKADPLADDVDDFQDVTPEPQNFEEVKVDNLVKLSESLSAKPRTEDDNAELYLLDILDPDLLTDSIEPENFGSLSDNLHTILSQAWPPVLKSGLAIKAKQKIIGRYPRPNNCRLLQTPTMNSKMAELVPEKIIANDDKWFKMQLCVGTAITAISRAMELLMLCESREKALRHLTNSCLILCDLHYTHTKIRKINVTPFVDDTTKAVIKDCQSRDETLFGPDFIEKWRAAKKSEPKPKKVKKKVAKSVKMKKEASSSGPSLVAYSGQWHPPLQKVRNRRSMAGARRPAAGAPPPPTPARRRVRPPRPARSPGEGVQWNRTKQLKQIEQYDYIGNEITSTPPDIEESHSHMQIDTEDRCVQEEVTDDVSKQSSVTYNRNNAVERPNYGAGTEFTVMHRTKQMERYDAWGNQITSTASTPPDMETSHSHMQTQMEARLTQVELVVDQLNQPRNTNKLKNPDKRKNPSDGTKPLKKLSTKKLQQTEQYDGFGNRITSIPASHPHMQIPRGGASRTRPVHEDPPLRRYTQAPHVQPTINYNPNNTVFITRGAIPLVLPPQMPSRDMPTLHSHEMPVLHSNDEPPDLIENSQTRAQVHHGIVDSVAEVDIESGVSLLLQFRHA